MNDHLITAFKNPMTAQQMSEVARRIMHIPRTAPLAYIVERDEQAHVEDTPLVSAVRDGKLVRLPWNALTAEERRRANNVTFYIYD